MSDNKLLVRSLVNINGLARDGIYSLPEPEARSLITRGLAILHREKPPAPSTGPEPGAAKKPSNKTQKRQGKPSPNRKNGSKAKPKPTDPAASAETDGPNRPADDSGESGTESDANGAESESAAPAAGSEDLDPGAGAKSEGEDNE